MSRRPRVAQAVCAFAVEAGAAVSYVEARAHAITALGTRRDRDPFLQRDAPDPEKRVLDDFSLELNLARVGNVCVETTTARAVSVRVAAIGRRLDDLNGVAERHPLLRAGDAHSDPLAGNCASHEDDLPLVTRNHPSAGGRLFGHDIHHATNRNAHTPSVRDGYLICAVVIEFRDVGFSYGQAAVLDRLTLTLDEGAVAALVGRSGTGKTTTLKLVNRMLEPHAGHVLVGGRDTREWDPIQLRRKAGYVIQEAGLLPHLTVAENVGLVPRLEAWDSGRVQARVADLLQLVDLPASAFGARYPRELSGGQRQRIAMARAIVGHPKLLIFDEVTSALDPATERDICRRISALAGDFTVIAITHRQAWSEIATKLYDVADGKVTEVEHRGRRSTPSAPLKAEP